MGESDACNDLTPLERVLREFEAPNSKGYSQLARALTKYNPKRPVSRQRVYSWCVRGQVPPHQAIPIERLVEGRVTRYELRPDVFGENDNSGGEA